jgi:hypothetical protein
MKSLAEEFDCKTAKEAENHLGVLDKRISKIETQLEEGFEQLQQDYPILFE